LYLVFARFSLINRATLFFYMKCRNPLPLSRCYSKKNLDNCLLLWENLNWLCQLLLQMDVILCFRQYVIVASFWVLFLTTTIVIF
jgi:hypothetical protein